MEGDCISDKHATAADVNRAGVDGDAREPPVRGKGCGYCRHRASAGAEFRMVMFCCLGPLPLFYLMSHTCGAALALMWALVRIREEVCSFLK